MAKVAQLRTLTAEGPVTVAVRKFGREYHCTALEFDILGTGKTKQEALVQVQELIEDYITSVIEELAKGHRVAFFNPSVEKDWNQADELRFFDVTLIVRDSRPHERIQLNAKDLKSVADIFESVCLEPSGA